MGTTRRRFLTIAVATAALSATLTVPAYAATPAPSLPEPSGPLPIGRTTMHLVDSDRADPWVPNEKRELMLSLWYPTLTPSGPPAQYMTADESRLYLEGTGVPAPPELMSTVATHSTVNARPIRIPGHRLPMVLLSPGFGMPRATLTGPAEELASRGYLVTAIGHNYESHATGFPDGHTSTCVACKAGDMDQVGPVRAADVSFVLDTLTGAGSPWRSRIDVDRIAMVGHSAGGFSTVHAMLTDSRVKAAVDLDGKFTHPAGVTIDRPMLMMGAEARVPGADRTWDMTWTELTGPKYWLTVEGTRHLSFTDLATLGKRAGMPQQDLDGDVADATTRAYVNAFLDRYLRRWDSGLLDGPSAEYPQVVFHRP